MTRCSHSLRLVSGKGSHSVFTKITEYLLVMDYVSGSDISLSKMLYFYKKIGVYKMSASLLAFSVGSAV